MTSTIEASPLSTTYHAPSAAPPATIDVSVLVPAKDEAENLPLFMEQAAAVFAAAGHSYEVIVIDDGSVDKTWAVLQALAEQYPFLRLARHRARRGIADALRTGYLAARGIKAQLQKLIEEEDPRHPLTDQAIVNILRESGVQIARRTVAKYRDQLGVLSARMRKRV